MKRADAVTLVAVQSELALAPYLSEAAFKAWIFAQCEEALAGLPDTPTLVAFPEMIGMPLLLTLTTPDTARATRLTDALAAVLKRDLLGTLRAFARRPWRGLAGALLPRALAAERAYAEAFSAAARAFGVTLMAGSSLLPPVDQEALRGHHLAEARVYNLGYTFSPTGTRLGVSRKTKFTPGLESRVGLARGAPSDLTPLVTPVGRVGVAICLDAFFESVVARFDGLGAQILVQPSANFAPWHGPWSGGRGLTEGAAWLRFGLRQMLQGRLNLAYGVNPMLVGEVWGLRAEGRSSIVANLRRLPAGTPEAGVLEAEVLEAGALEAGAHGVVALAQNPTRFEVVRATLPWPDALPEAVR